MPYKDPTIRRESVRLAVQKHRVGAVSPPRKPLPELQGLRLENARSVLELVRRELDKFLKSKNLQPSERLRGALAAAGTLLRGFEQQDILDRLETLEAHTQPKAWNQ